MKQILIIPFLITTLLKGQNYIPLETPAPGDTISLGYAAIYGNFIQRLGFSSGGFPQDIRLINTQTKEVLSFRVKQTFRSKKQSSFFYFIPPGTYAILNYWWTKSTWYGGKMYTETIYKGEGTTATQYLLTLEPNTLNYLGTWHFDSPNVFFSDDKMTSDSLNKKKFPRFDFSTAKTVLPK